MADANHRLELHSLTLCDYALTARDGKISAIGIFSQINVARVPAVHGRCFIVAFLEASPGIHELTINLIAPSGRNVIQRPPRLRINVPDNASTANVLADLKGLRLDEIGRHQVELRSGERLLGSTPFIVNLVLQAPPATA